MGNGPDLRLVEGLKRPRGVKAPPLPSDGPLISLQDAAGYLRLSLAATRKRMYRATDEIGRVLHANRVSIAGRWFIKREPFMHWMREKSG